MKFPTRRLISNCVFAGLMGFALVGCDQAQTEVDTSTITPVSVPEYDPDVSTDPAVQSSNTLAFELYDELVRQGDAGDNMVFSPASISAALMLTYEGARGNTQTEFEQVLSLDARDRSQSHASYAGMLGRLSGEDTDYELSVANALWVERGMPLRDAFVQTMRRYYEASIESVNFVGEPDKQRRLINAWVSGRTHDRINDLLGEGTITTDTRLVLVNALYFQAQWAMTFEEGATRDMPFHLLPTGEGADAQSVEVPMMRQSMEHFRYADMDGFDAVQLSYEGGDLSMVVLLPEEIDGLSDLEAQLSPELIDQTVESMRGTLLNLSLPRWETTQDYDLIPALQALGLQSAFGDAADFTGFTDHPEGDRLFVSDVVHKAFIAVDESGTEAAAATAVVVSLESAVIGEPIEFSCDHPFVYLIRDNRTGAILFLGRVTDPS